MLDTCDQVGWWELQEAHWQVEIKPASLPTPKEDDALEDFEV